ncbi:ornithine carbamoyltransferase [Candidatus Hakubella thermalkaliphila]|uniref:N-acetylornithine carbamoyltransferase n=1 Tax=Candidatus Hakubella thermalkaliphila TaxID=2754717 RepID=A0A6V8PFS2_9ACTN|nr:ornithine carbamoyltransferase [Candidatus Hakubella thermalkaliphila]GFP31193.1 N-acetylornithine carbamoyltransferase [Candidatus Hakubella thermalkaliphila]
MDLYGKDFLCTQEWEVEELMAVLDLAAKMKRDRFSPRWSRVLENKTFFMFFYNPSVRTRQSFECAATELGGHAQFLEPGAMRLKTEKTAGETIEDATQVMSRYASGLGIRILEDKIGAYGEGDDLLRQYARWASIPIISMAHDKYHPCQGLADIMGWAEWFGQGPGHTLDMGVLEGKKLLMTWGHGALARSWCSVQEGLLIASRFGMHITLACPEGYDLDPQVIEWTKTNCGAHGTEFQIVHDPCSGYEGAHVVYSRHWMSPRAYVDGEFQKQKEVEMALKYPQWICDEEKMALTTDAIFTHPMPVDRGHEVTDAVASGPRSVIYNVAENRLHVQKALMALTMGNL